MFAQNKEDYFDCPNHKTNPVIDLALDLIRRRLNDHLVAKFGVDDVFVALSPLMDEEGKPAAAARNRLAMFVTNIAHDAMPRGGKRGLSRQIGQPDAIHVDVYFMLAASYETEIYDEGLKMISAGMIFFQSNPIFTPQNTPDMPNGLEQMSVEMSNLRSEELGQMWGNLGGRYVPSVMYKLRSVLIDGAAVQRVDPLVRRPGQSVKPEAERVPT